MIELDARDLKRAMTQMRQAMAAGADGKIMKRELSKRLRGLMAPLVQEQKARILGTPSKGHKGASMRQAIAKQTKAAVRWSGSNIGVQVTQRGRSMPRDFRLAGRAFNREEGWHPQNLGGVVMHQQVRPSAWFDQPTHGQASKVKHEVMEALQDAAGKIADKAR